MRTHDYTVTLDLPNYGTVTAEITYGVGFSGSYWEPPDSDEVIVNKIVNADGREIQLSDSQYEEYYNLFLQAGGEIHSSYMDQVFNRYAEEYLAEESDTSTPF